MDDRLIYGDAIGARCKKFRKNLFNYYTIGEIMRCMDSFRMHDAEGWLAGNLGKDDLTKLWPAGVDVFCAQGATSEANGGNERCGVVTA